MLSEKGRNFFCGGYDGNLTKISWKSKLYKYREKRGVLKSFAAKSCLKGESFCIIIR